MGMALAREINQRFIEGPHRAEPRPDPSRAFAAVSRAVRLTLILEARTEKQILAWRRGDLASLDALEPEPFLAPRFDSPAERRARVRDCVAAAIDRETLDPHEAEGMRGRLRRELIETEDLGDHRLKGGFRACVEAICADLGLKPDWSRWSDDHGFGFAAEARRRPRTRLTGHRRRGPRPRGRPSVRRRARRALPASPAPDDRPLRRPGPERSRGETPGAGLARTSSMPLDAFTNTFAGNPLDRVSERRSDPAWIAEKLAAPESLAVALWNGRPLVEDAKAGGVQIAYLSARMAGELAGGHDRLLFLGLWKETAVFAVDLESDTDPADARWRGSGASRTCA